LDKIFRDGQGQEWTEMDGTDRHKQEWTLTFDGQAFQGRGIPEITYFLKKSNNST